MSIIHQKQLDLTSFISWRNVLYARMHFAKKQNPPDVDPTGLYELFLSFFFEAIFLVEAVDTSVRCSEFLASSVEWVAF